MARVRVIEEGDEFLLYWGDCFWKKSHKAVVFSGLRELSKASSLEEAEEIFKGVEMKAAKALVMRWLSAKGMFTAEIEQKLEEKGFSFLAIGQTLLFCEKIGALNDKNLIEEKIGKELRKGRGHLSAVYKLKKWVPVENLCFDSVKVKELERESILNYLYKKKVDIHSMEGFLGRQEKIKLLFALMKRGFKKENIEEVLWGKN